MRVNTSGSQEIQVAQIAVATPALAPPPSLPTQLPPSLTTPPANNFNYPSAAKAAGNIGLRRFNPVGVFLAAFEAMSGREPSFQTAIDTSAAWTDIQLLATVDPDQFRYALSQVHRVLALEGHAPSQARDVIDRVHRLFLDQTQPAFASAFDQLLRLHRLTPGTDARAISQIAAESIPLAQLLPQLGIAAGDPLSPGEQERRLYQLQEDLRTLEAFYLIESGIPQQLAYEWLGLDAAGRLAMPLKHAATALPNTIYAAQPAARILLAPSPGYNPATTDLKDIMPELVVLPPDDERIEILRALLTGELEAIDGAALFDYHGNISTVFEALHTRAAAAWDMSPTAFAALSQRGDSPPSREAKYSPEAPLYVARELLPHLDGAVEYHYFNPVSSQLQVAFAPRVVKAWDPSVPVVFSIKGLVPVSGNTPIEQMTEVLAKSTPIANERPVLLGIEGYLPAKGYKELARLDLVVLTGPDLRSKAAAEAWAQLMTGPGATRSTSKQGLTTFTSIGFTQPLSVTIVTDPNMVRANELASIYKNSSGIALGMALFDEMDRLIHLPKPKRPGDIASYLEGFERASREGMKVDMAAGVIALELGIQPKASPPTLRSVGVLPAVEADVDGSWGVKNIAELYQGLAMARAPNRHYTSDERQKALQAWAKGSQKYFSVRNIWFGFLYAAQASVSRKGVGQVSPQDSLIPADLRPEGIGIAASLRSRFARRYPEGYYQQLPLSFRTTVRQIEAHPEFYNGTAVDKKKPPSSPQYPLRRPPTR